MSMCRAAAAETWPTVPTVQVSRYYLELQPLNVHIRQLSGHIESCLVEVPIIGDFEFLNIHKK